MVFTCIVQGCRKSPEPYVRSLHGFPDNLETTNAWNEFVKRTKPQWSGNTPSSRICSEHFLPACYKNHMAWSMGWVRTLELVDDFQVPTIYPAEIMKTAASPIKVECKQERSPSPPVSSAMSEPPHGLATVKTEPGQECEVKPECRVMYVVRHVASQTDPPLIPRDTIGRHTADQKTSLSKYSFAGETDGPRLWRLHRVLRQSHAVPTTNTGEKTIQETSSQPGRFGGRPSERVTASTAVQDKNSTV